MLKFARRQRKKVGLPPGSLVHTGVQKIEKVKIQIIAYDEKNFMEKEVASIEDCLPFKGRPTVTWINIDGLHDAQVIEKIEKPFGIHPLTLEDIMNIGQRPKLEAFEDHLFIVLRMLSFDKESRKIRSEQVSLILGPDFVFSFQETDWDLFNPIRDRIRTSQGRLRRLGGDYLAYSLMDIIVDQYFLILESFGDVVEEIEEELMDNPSPNTLQEIRGLKRDLINLRRSVWPLREVVAGLERSESSLIDEKTSVYFRDVYDHTIQVIETVETFRDMVSGMLDMYLSSVSNKMNEIMKVLTIIATIFIPLTFITGLYGMNFEYMPELEWQLGYPMVWLVMIAITVVMAAYFRRKGWL
ncbi:MAG: magnesium/cobalt transporter CorA [Candidatus Thorarchaeota archaeon]